MMAPFRIVFLGVIAGVFVVGMLNMLMSFEDNGCEMTYMYQMPEYLIVPLPRKVRQQFPRYGLRLYGEGHYAAQSANMKLSGIPVIFIPGNAGSYKQVRSLGSVALKMAESRGTKFHFNFFSLDLNEEFSGLYGGVLWEQAQFAHACIRHILSLYSKNPDGSRPRSVLVVGHSMGGMVGRAMFALRDFDSSLVTTLITQATPHQAPVISLDGEMANFYRTVNTYWKAKRNTTLRVVAVFSTGGGFRDLIVRSTLTNTRGLVDPDRSHSSLTMATPLGWVSTDHLCHVWCKQIVMATVRSLFDMTDRGTNQIAQGTRYKTKVWKYHFEKNPGPIRYQPAYDEVINLDSTTKWEIRQKISWSFNRDKLSSQRYSVIPLPRLADHAFVVITNIDSVAWIGVCKVKPEEERCPQLMNLAPHANVLPPLYSDRKVLHVPTEKLLDGALTHLVVILPKSRRRVEVVADMYNMTARNIRYSLPNLFTMWSWNGTLPPEIVVNRTEPEAVFYNISIVDHGTLLDAYTAHLISEDCKDVPLSGNPGSVMQLHTPWSLNDLYSFVKLGRNGNISLRLQNPKPGNIPRHAELHLYLHRACRYKIVIDRDWPAILGQFVRYYWPYLPAFIIVQMFMALAWQLSQLDEEGAAPSFPAAHARWAQPWRVVPVAYFVHFLTEYPEDSSLRDRIGLPLNDITILSQRGLWLPALPIFLYLTAYAFTELYSYVFHLQLSTTARVLGWIFRRCCVSLRVLHACVILEYFLFAVAIATAGFVSGALGLLLVMIIYTVKTGAHYIWGSETEDAMGDAAWNRYHVNTTLLMLFQGCFIFNFPSLIAWWQGLQYSLVMSVDPGRWGCLAICVAALLLTVADVPATVTDVYSVSQGTLYISSLLTILYAMENAHRITAFIAGNLLILAVPITVLVIITKLTTSSQHSKEAAAKKIN